MVVFKISLFFQDTGADHPQGDLMIGAEALRDIQQVRDVNKAIFRTAPLTTRPALQ